MSLGSLVVRGKWVCCDNCGSAFYEHDPAPQPAEEIDWRAEYDACVEKNNALWEPDARLRAAAQAMVEAADRLLAASETRLHGWEQSAAWLDAYAKVGRLRAALATPQPAEEEGR